MAALYLNWYFDFHDVEVVHFSTFFFECRVLGRSYTLRAFRESMRHQIANAATLHRADGSTVLYDHATRNLILLSPESN
jgi:hypothetical protein